MTQNIKPINQTALKNRLNEKMGAWFVGFVEFGFAGGAGFFE
jgi:hypothetical protein